MKMLIVDRYYLNMVHNKSAESNIFTSADHADNVGGKKFSSVGGLKYPERGGKQIGKA